MWTTDSIKKIVTDNPIVLFAKGTKEQPMCGFSHRAIEILNQVVPNIPFPHDGSAAANQIG